MKETIGHNTQKSLAQYFREIKKYPVLNEEEEDDLTEDIMSEVEFIKDSLLRIPLAWNFLVQQYSSLKSRGKVSSKMSKEFNSASKSYAATSSKLDKYMGKSHKIFGGRPSPFLNKEERKKIAWLVKESKISTSYYFKMVPELKRFVSGDCEYITGMDQAEFVGIYTEIEESLKRIEKLKEKLFCANLRLVVQFAYNYKKSNSPVEDLIQEGNIAMMKAIDKYDPTKDNRFAAYAGWWLKQAMIKFYRDHSKIIRLPSHIHDQALKIQKAMTQSESESFEEVAKECKMKIEDIERLEEVYSEPISIESSSDVSGSPSQVRHLLDFLEADNIDVEEEINKKQEIAIMQNVLTGIPEEYRQVLTLKFGLEDTRPRNNEEIARIMKIPRETVRDIVSAALHMLKERMGTRD